jgi:ubiquinone biosynthesis protein
MISAILSTMITVIGVLVVAVLYAVCVGAITRRILGAPVGWPRTFIVGLAVFLASSPVATSIATASGLVGASGKPTVSLAVAVLFLALAFAWVFAFGILALVIFEAIWPTGSVPDPVTLAREWLQRGRRIRRYLHILAIASRHGLRVFWTDRPRGRRLPPTEHEQMALGLVATLNEAGVTFVKLGQLLSTRRDLLPRAYVEALSQLQTQARPEPWSSIRAVIEHELGAPIGTVFAWVEEMPLAAASIAQVHRARLTDGADVVVKVQRPTARAQVEADIDILLRLAQRIEARTTWGRELGAVALAQGFAESLREELDYRIEYRNTEMIRRSCAHDAPADASIRVPRVFAHASTQRVLTMEELHGTALGEAGPRLATLSTDQRKALASGVFDAVLRQILLHGVFHADLHPGNLILLDDHTLGMLDFGAIGVLDRDMRELLALLLLAADNEDNIAAADTLLLLAEVPDGLNVAALRHDIGRMLTMMRYQTGGETALFTRLFDVVRQHRLGVPPHVAAAFRTITALQGGLTLIDPEFDVMSHARTHAPQMLKDLFTVSSVAGMLQSQAAVFLAVGKRLPHRLESITADLEQGKLGVRVRSFATPEERAWITSLVNESISALLAVTAIIGAIILIVTQAGPLIAPHVRLYAFIGYALGFVGFILALRAIIRLFFGRVRP